jgi:hypothetical protein
MGILKFFKGKNHNNEDRQQNNETPSSDNNQHESQQNTETPPTSPTPRRSTLIRRVSTNTMRKLRMLGQTLRLIGDDVERRSLERSSTNINVRDDGVTRDVVSITTQNNTDIDVAARNARNVDNNTDDTNCKSQTEGDCCDHDNTTEYSSDVTGTQTKNSNDTDVQSDNNSSNNNRHSTEI